MNSTKTRSIAPKSTLSANDRAAHDASSHLSPKGRAALARATDTVGRWNADEVEAAYAERDRQPMDAYRAWVLGGAA